MPNKTITLEIDACAKLRAAKRGGESFTEVGRRAVIPDAAPTGEMLRKHYRHEGGKVSDEYHDTVEQAAANDPIPRRSMGLILNDNDLWIAAAALVHGMARVTENRNEFKRVPGLEVTGY